VFEPFAEQEVLADQDGHKILAVFSCLPRHLPDNPFTLNEALFRISGVRSALIKLQDRRVITMAYTLIQKGR
jgi:hypothetical protein